jgi:pimeloyl-ACP methyl ester carboxylesterase
MIFNKEQAEISSQGVVLLHGIFRTGRSMRSLEKFLQVNGFATLNITFPSTKLSIEEIVERIHLQIEEFTSKVEGPISFVTYSLGGLIARAYLHKYPLQKMGRVVMMGPPNNGSELADRLQNWRLYKKFYGPAGQQLITSQEKFKHLFGDVHYELGIIAGNLTVEPISSLFINWPNDGKVSVASTRLEGMKDHLIVRVPHSYFTFLKRIHRQVLHFLLHGEFSRVKTSRNK